MDLLDYIDEHFMGNKAAFGRAFDRTPQHITKIMNNADQWLVIIEDEKHLLVQVKYFRDIEPEDETITIEAS